MKLVTTAQMRELETFAVNHGATWAGLMEQAGLGVAQAAVQYIRRGARIVVLVGPGNNGGDGLVAARRLHDVGSAVQLYLWNRPFNLNDENRQHCRQRGIAELEAEHDPDCSALFATLSAADLIIDALLGAGISRPVSGELATIVHTVNRVRMEREPRCTILAVDLPTGVSTDTGAIHGVAIHANVSVATGAIKRGMLFHPGRAAVGKISLAPIGIPPHALETVMSELLTADHARRLLPPRPGSAHKGLFGKVLIVGGSLHYPGAASLACAGAGRVGAGLVTLAAGRTVLGSGGRGPETTLLPVAEQEWGVIGPDAIEEISQSLETYQVLLIGPGLGTAEPTKAFIRHFFGFEQPKSRNNVGFLPVLANQSSPAIPLPPTVIDADGLNLLALNADWFHRLPRERCILTPHPGEMRRLLNVDALPSDLITCAHEAAQTWGQVVVLKGATSVIAHPDGRTLVYDGSNPALATAGTGDVLAGAIAGLVAQGLPLFEAAALGVYLHGAAGLRVRDKLGDAGALASDLLPQLPQVIRVLRES